MSDRDKGPEEPWLFDLPLSPPGDDGGDDGGDAEPEAPEPEAPEPDAAPAASHPRRPGAAGDEPETEALPLFPDEPPPPSAERPPPVAAGGGAVPAPSRPRPVPEPAAPLEPAAAPQRRRPRPAGLRPRLLSALADTGVHLLVLAAGAALAAALGVPLGVREAPAFAVYLLAFSFLYSVVSLAFWGRTPGMLAAGLLARGAGGQPLTFGQTGLRWLAGLLTAVLAGLPLLLGLTHRSLADRLSGSQTYEIR